MANNLGNIELLGLQGNL